MWLAESIISRISHLNNATLMSEPTQTKTKYDAFPQPPQTSLFSRCQDSSSWGPSVLCYYQRGALSSCFIHIQRQDQTVCRQTEGDLQQGEVQWWEMALGQWTPIILITFIIKLNTLLFMCMVTVACRSYSVWRRRNFDWLWMGSEPRMASWQMLNWHPCSNLCHLCISAVSQSLSTRSWR